VWAIYRDAVLNRYAAGANPWIRLIVRNGEVTLEGYVDREGDKDIAFIRANGVAGAFSVTNNLKLKS
jgi:osmotically-inducible protein OsmY